ncbi:MAG: helix-turn-helix domain-containing protein [Campylobacteraceae bacterium]
MVFKALEKSINYNLGANESFKIYNLLIKDMVPPHTHTYYEMFFVHDGEGVFCMNDKIYDVEKNTILLVSPNTGHQWTSLNNIHATLIKFDNSLFIDSNSSKFLDIFYFDKIVTTDENHQALINILTGFITETEKNMPFQDIALNNLAVLLLIHLRRALPSDKSPSRMSTLIFAKLNKVLKENSYKINNPIFYAEKIKTPLKVLNGVVKEFTGLTCGDYIRKAVMIEAKRLLNNETINSNEIALMLGFEDAAYFSRFFKRESGLPPKKFRVHKS